MHFWWHLYLSFSCVAFACWVHSTHFSDATTLAHRFRYVFKARKDEAELARIAKLKKREAAKLKIKEKEDAD